MHQILPKQPEAIPIFWGNKETITNFLNSPGAQAERWYIRECPECGG